MAQYLKKHQTTTQLDDSAVNAFNELKDYLLAQIELEQLLYIYCRVPRLSYTRYSA